MNLVFRFTAILQFSRSVTLQGTDFESLEHSWLLESHDSDDIELFYGADGTDQDVASQTSQ